MSDTLSGARPMAASAASHPLYVAAWRWHFYAGLYVVPFLLMLAVTGFLMMLLTTYWPEYGDRLTVEPGATILAVSDQTKAALDAVAGAETVKQYIAPYSATTPAIVTVLAGETGIVVAVNPYDGTALRITPEGGTWNAFAETVHGTLMLGSFGDLLIEIAASLGLLMIVTGLYLWWPRGGERLSSRLIPDLGAKGRGLWKSLHLVTGGWVSLILVFFFLTGLAWAGIWGGKFTQAWSTFPAEKWDNVPLSDKLHESMNHEGEKDIPWGLELTPLPESDPHAGHQAASESAAINLDRAYALGRKLGFVGRFQIAVPQDEKGVWTLSQDSMSYDGTPPNADRTVHLDQYTGKVLADVGYQDYGAAAKAMAVGIALHEGQLGLWNVVVNGVFCAAVVLLCLSGIVMWWMRRPSGTGRLVAPYSSQSVPLTRGIVLIAVAMSMVFPVLGLTLMAVLLVDLILLGAVPPLKRALS